MACVYTVIPRRKRKAGASSGVSGAAKVKPIKIALEILDRLSNLSLSQAADSLGISSTAMKKSCRKLGVRRWPYKSDQPSVCKHQIDDAYVRKIQRKYADSLKKGPACTASSCTSTAAASGLPPPTLFFARCSGGGEGGGGGPRGVEREEWRDDDSNAIDDL